MLDFIGVNIVSLLHIDGTKIAAINVIDGTDDKNVLSQYDFDIFKVVQDSLKANPNLLIEPFEILSWNVLKTSADQSLQMLPGKNVILWKDKTSIKSGNSAERITCKKTKSYQLDRFAFLPPAFQHQINMLNYKEVITKRGILYKKPDTLEGPGDILKNIEEAASFYKEMLSR